MTKVFNSLEEMKPYYNADINAYVFKDDDGYLNVKLNFNLCVESSIDAMDIYARSIYAINIDARDINAQNISTERIDAQLIEPKETLLERIKYMFLPDVFGCVIPRD